MFHTLSKHIVLLVCIVCFADTAFAQPASKQAAQQIPANSQPKFIDDITLSNSHTIQDSITISTNKPSKPPVVTNTDTAIKATAIPVTTTSVAKKPVPVKVKAKTIPAKSKIQVTTMPAVVTPKTIATAPVIDSSDYEDDSTETFITSTVIVNRDCPTPMNGNQYDNLYLSTMQKAAKDRLSFLSSNLKYCFSTNQVSLLAKSLINDEQRYLYLKDVYTHISDQYNFHSLEDLLTATEWKAKFRSIQK